ncbi:hypothetical protein RWE15_06235 [Virgibacillus halophilus]|uniref:Uncharacterized protein n=1 Tax=Tigheibacillus halophilus TaxID=361280 RepID=A0ABU5C499_9BACI|nr:hypothetical protein [Virgibacillus halophilus]
MDKKKKTFYAKGTGKGYKRAWGGSKEIKLNSLSKYKNDFFVATVTVQVGKQMWYRGKIGGKTVWIHMDDLTAINEKSTNKLGHIKKKQCRYL